MAPHQTVAQAAQLMAEKNVGSLVVLDETGALIGIVTEQDIVRKSAAIDANPGTIPVSAVMSPNAVTARAGIPLSDARKLMTDRGIRHLPLLDKGRVVGLISSRDVLAHELASAEAMKIAAEQVAMLARCLRRLDLDEMVEILRAEIPRSLDAKRWLLHVEDEESTSPADTSTSRGQCSRTLESFLADKELDGEVETLQPAPPAACGQDDCEGCRVLLPLDGDGCAGGGRSKPSFLCMCGIEKLSGVAGEATRYKIALMWNILKVNLASAKLYRAARRDPLTDLKTRRVLEEELAQEHARSCRNGRPFCVAVLDLDGFKQVNDRHGHQAGDRLLIQWADLLRGNSRAYDLSARYGGDEFVVLMPETRLEGSQAMVERLCRRAEDGLAAPDGQKVTVSCGLAEWSGREDESASEVLRRADLALYDAKRAGRNRVVTSPTPTPAPSAAAA